MTTATRNSEIYISWRVRKGLSLAVLLYKDGDTSVTSDSLADEVLTAWLAKTHPEIVAHLDAIEEKEAAFKKSLTKPLPL